MNILFVGHEMKLNGASMCLLEIIDRLFVRHTITVLTPYNVGEVYEELKSREYIDLIYYPFHLWMEIRPKSYIKWIIKKSKRQAAIFLDIFKSKKLLKTLSEKKFDLVHSNTSVIYFGAYLARHLGIPHIWHIREFGKKDFNFYPIFCEKFTWRYMSKNTQAFIAISQAIKNKYSLVLPIDKIYQIYDGIVIPSYEKTHIFNENKINLLIAARISEAKGQNEAIKVLAELKHRGYQNYYLYIAGKGDITVLTSMPEFKEVKNQVFFLGFVQNIQEIRIQMDFELVCSKSEGFGRITVEAMMLGNPVIGSNTGATTELIKQGINGFLYQKGNISDFADKILMASKVDIYNTMSRNAYHQSRKLYSIENNIQEIEKVYRSVVL